MGPRFCKRGNPVIEDDQAAAIVASMGPRFCKRGNRSGGLSNPRSSAPLQWGHAFVSVETSASQPGASLADGLQWGHAFVSVETLAERVKAWALSGFNGATLL